MHSDPIELLQQTCPAVDLIIPALFAPQFLSLHVGKPALADGTSRLLEQVIKGADKVFCHIVIRIRKGKIFPARCINACISSPGQSGIFLVNHTDSVIFFGVCITDFRTAIQRSVVYQNNFQVPVGLCQQAFHTPAKICLYLINRNNDAD